MAHENLAQLAAILGAGGVALVILPPLRAAFLAGVALLAASEALFGVALAEHAVRTLLGQPDLERSHPRGLLRKRRAGRKPLGRHLGEIGAFDLQLPKRCARGLAAFLLRPRERQWRHQQREERHAAACRRLRDPRVHVQASLGAGLYCSTSLAAWARKR